MKEHAICPTRSEDFSEWFAKVIELATLADHSPSRGCMVIRPYGYAIWEKMQKDLDRRFKKKGVQNAYFPLFIPMSYFQKEADHVAGFAKECAIVTHHRLEEKEGKLVPSGPLEEPLVVRPTSEMIIGDSFSKWIQSWRDLPLLINQWANVVRWEMRTRLFLRTAEFLWQEGHTAHATALEAQEFAAGMLDEYVDFAKTRLCLPVFAGKKSKGEQFPGAEWTLTFEAMMQDGKALQCGTSHYLGQNFAKASDVGFLSSSGQREYAHTTSWGVTTRMIGAIIMAHGDDDGLILPPPVAPYQVVIIPYDTKDTGQEVIEFCHCLADRIRERTYLGEMISVHVDTRAMRGGEKSWDWVKKGAPLRLEIGARDIKEGLYPLFYRTRAKNAGEKLEEKALLDLIPDALQTISSTLYEKANTFLQSNTRNADTLETFEQLLPLPGFVAAHFEGDVALEEKIKEKYGVTIRCFPKDLQNGKESKCIFTGKPTTNVALFGKSY